MLLDILQYIACGATVLVGVVPLIAPRSVEGFTGLKAPGPRGVTELRAVMGGFFIALGLAPLLFQADAAFKMLGMAYLVVGGIRAVSIFIDRSMEQSNLISLLTEVVLGIVLVL